MWRNDTLYQILPKALHLKKILYQVWPIMFLILLEYIVSVFVLIMLN